MEIRQGYKITEVGLIPEDWEVCHLSRLVASGPKNGYSARSGKNARGTPTLTLTATSSGRTILNEETIKYLEETLDPYSDIFLKPGDVLVQRSNTSDLVGTTAIFDGPGGVYAYPDLMMRLRFHAPETAHWFWRYANSSNGRRYFIGVAAGSTGTMPKICGDKLRNMPIPLAKSSEQQLIATVLSDVDALLEALERLVAKKRDLKQAAVQQLLMGQTRLPGYEKVKGYKITEVGIIPQDWDSDYTENFARIFTGGKNTQDREEDGQYPFFVRSQTIERINSYSFDGEAVLTAGDGVGTGKVFHYINGRFDVHQRVYRICDFAEHVDGYFFFLYFSSHFYDRIMQMTAKSSVDSVRREMIARMLVPLPPSKDEQSSIAKAVRDMDAELAALEERMAKTRDLKQAMMQDLLTGRTRLL